LIGDENQPEGYVVFNQHSAARGYNLQRDLVILTQPPGMLYGSSLLASTV